MYTQMLQVHASVWPTESDITSNINRYQPEPHNVNYPLPEGKNRNTHRERISENNSDILVQIDPRCWSREDVLKWLWNMQKQHNLPPISADRFHMNGKALCLMNVDMFVQRVPLGGKLLFKDFQIRLTQALYSSKMFCVTSPTLTG